MSLSACRPHEARSSSTPSRGSDRRRELDRKIPRLTSGRSLRVVTDASTGSLAEQAQIDSDDLRARTVFEDLGPPFSAAAFDLAARTDLLPLRLCRALRQTRAELQEVPRFDLRTFLRKKLGAPVEDVFSEIEPSPFSIRGSTQSYRARLANGDPVRLDLLHPTVPQRMDDDRAAVAKLQPALERWLARSCHRAEERDLGRRASLASCLAGIRRAVELETDFSQRASDLALLQKDRFEPDAPYIPRLYSELSTPDLLVTESVGGSLLEEVFGSQLQATKTQLRTVARRLAALWLRQALAGSPTPRTPSPATTRILPGGALAFDVAASFRLPTTERGVLDGYLHWMALQDPEAACSILLPLWPEIDGSMLLRESRQLMPEHETFELGPGHHLSTQILLHERRLTQLGAPFPSPLSDFFRGLSWLHFTCQEIAPEIDALREASEHLQLRRDLSRLRSMASLEPWSREIGKGLELWSELPQKVDAFLDAATADLLPDSPRNARSRPGHLPPSHRLLFATLLLLLVLLRLEAQGPDLRAWLERLAFAATLVAGGVLLFRMGEGP